MSSGSSYIETDGKIVVPPFRARGALVVVAVVLFGFATLGAVPIVVASLRIRAHVASTDLPAALCTGLAAALWLGVLCIIFWKCGTIALWQLFGKEVISFSTRGLLVGRFVMGVGRRRWIDVRSIRGIGVNTDELRTEMYADSAIRRAMDIHFGWIHVDYDEDTMIFGQGLSTGDAERIVARISRTLGSDSCQQAG